MGKPTGALVVRCLFLFPSVQLCRDVMSGAVAATLRSRRDKHEHKSQCTQEAEEEDEHNVDP